jgi:hypothetical protein
MYEVGGEEKVLCKMWGKELMVSWCFFNVFQLPRLPPVIPV